ncbi:hypothetical protein SCHPADRAFT_342734 [Schizopora paradoxa]|uniref:F-box domain-containing protein n=1 Tax=Schizopora paradoxa TaxID=27342 RepID=A0A0H2RWK5_9AGAM|nr:hypothetical protein SCHPADRAFT_342734 [Schizopora paradoxa]
MDPRSSKPYQLSYLNAKYIPWTSHSKWTKPYQAPPAPRPLVKPVKRKSAVHRIPSEIWNIIFLYAIVRHGGKRPVVAYRPATYRLETYVTPRVGISANLPQIEEFECVNDIFLLRSILKVCRLWRATAVNSQLLWRYVRNDLPMHFVMKMFQRSGEQPLYADIEFDEAIHEKDAECIQEILGRMSRIKTLKFDAPDSEMFSRYLHWFEQSAPKLQNLALTSRPQAETLLLQGQLPDVAVLSHNAFNVCTPALRTLLLENVVIPWDSQFFYGGNLTHVHLRFIPSHCQMSLSETMKWLGHFRHLELFEMISAGPKDTFLDMRKGERLCLAHLRSLSLQGMTNVITQAFMANLRTPVLTTLDIRHEGSAPPDARHILPAGFASFVTEMSGLELNVAVVPGQINLGVYFVDASDSEPKPKPTLVCKFIYKHGNAASIDVDVPILLSALDRMQFTINVVSLHIDINQANLRNRCQLTPYLLHQLLWRMPQANLLRFVPAAIGKMKLSAEPCLISLCALRGYFEVDGDADARAMVVGTKPHAPALKTIVFEGMTWDAMNVAKLVDWLRIRVLQKAKMERICFVGDDSLALLGVGQFFEGIVTHCDFYTT